MSRPITGQALLRTGIVLALYPFNFDQGIEIQRAPDDGSGEPNVGSAAILTQVNAGVETYTDVLPIDGANRHYRTRHRVGNATSDWTGWMAATPITIPDPLPVIVDLVPSIEVVQTISETSVSFVATAILGEISFGIVEFQDPERTFSGTGSINAASTTLTVSDGDFTDEDVNLYISVADAGVAGGLLESRVDSVTGPTVVELVDAATGTVNTKDVILGGGWFSDFDFDGNDESNETNTRNRPIFGRDSQWIMFRTRANNEVSSPQLINLSPQVQATLLEFDMSVFDDNGGSGDDQYTFVWTPSLGVTDTHSIDFEGGKEDDRNAVLVSGSEGSPASNSSKQIDDVGAADGSDVLLHWGRATLKDASFAILGTWEIHDETASL